MTDNQTAVLIITIPALIAAIHHHQMMLKHGRLQRTGGSQRTVRNVRAVRVYNVRAVREPPQPTANTTNRKQPYTA